MTEVKTLEDEIVEVFGRDQDLRQLHGVRREGTPGAIKRVGIIGGGTAGYFAALMLRRQVPNVEVTLIESSKIPIIGVGEATTPPIITFLHKALGLDIHEFYREVKPTWKLGISFEWGLPAPYHFQAPFDWATGDIGILGSLAYTGDINAMAFQSLLMEHDKVQVLRDGNSIMSLMHSSSFAYHLDNGRLVKYVHRKALEAGVLHIDSTVIDAEVDASGERIETLITDGGQRLSFDLYVDCSGFRSLLLEGKLKVPFISYESSLLTDRALAFNAPHGGKIRPYTLATTMNSGWCWRIPMVEDDHLGYVFSSRFCSQDEAEAELRERFPTAGPTRLVKFRSGRHAEAWRGNVFAVGNAYAFVEPLESSGILMIMNACAHLAGVVARSTCDESAYRNMLNASIARQWDSLRWFLAIHYKFNHRLKTPFWSHVQAEADVSGVADIIKLFEERAPLRLRGADVRELLVGKLGVFYDLGGFDCIMLGQKVRTTPIEPVESREDWEKRRALGMRMVQSAMTMSEVLELITSHPGLLDDFMTGEGWPNHEYTLFSNFSV